MAKIERKYFAHFIDVSFGGASAEYVRLGKDLEEYNIELNPDTETVKNILGEQSTRHNGYEVSSEVDPFYAYSGDKLYEQLAKIANERLTGDDCATTVVDVLIDGSTGNVEWAYKEDVIVVPTSMGGDTSGVQIPFSINYNGNRTKGTFNLTTKTFAESET